MRRPAVHQAIIASRRPMWMSRRCAVGVRTSGGWRLACPIPAFLSSVAIEARAAAGQRQGAPRLLLPGDVALAAAMLTLRSCAPIACLLAALPTWACPPLPASSRPALARTLSFVTRTATQYAASCPLLTLQPAPAGHPLQVPLARPSAGLQPAPPAPPLAVQCVRALRRSQTT